ncbi:hypothetical protein GCM10017322_06380 [Paracoccus aerius]|nr:hypothetical protein GCM10017322_06380 [Paracoccus aerius]
MMGCADLAHEQQIQRRIQGPGDGKRDRHPAAWQGQHNAIPAPKMPKAFRKLPPGIGPVSEEGRTRHG